MTIFAGGMLGVGFGALREIMDRGFRTREQVRVCSCDRVPRAGSAAKGWQFEEAVGPTAGYRREPARGVNLPISIVHRMGPRSIRSPSRMLRTVLDSPSSPYAEAIRSIKLNRGFKEHSSNVYD